MNAQASETHNDKYSDWGFAMNKITIALRMGNFWRVVRRSRAPIVRGWFSFMSSRLPPGVGIGIRHVRPSTSRRRHKYQIRFKFLNFPTLLKVRQARDDSKSQPSEMFLGQGRVAGLRGRFVQTLLDATLQNDTVFVFDQSFQANWGCHQQRTFD